MIETFDHLNDTDARAYLANVRIERRKLEAELAELDKYRDKWERKEIRRKIVELEAKQVGLKNRLHEISQVQNRPGSARAPIRGRTPPGEIPTDGFLAALTSHRAVVEAFKAAYKQECEYLTQLLDEGYQRGLLNPDGTPAALGAIPHGVIPTLEEVARPLGVVSGFHNSPGPHFPHHDTRRIYAGK